MPSVSSFITSKLKLKVNGEKSAVARPWERKFLGFSFTSGEEPKRRIAPKALKRFKERVRERTRRTGGRSIEHIVQKLAVYLIGWRTYFGFCETPSILQQLDEWVHRRLRCVVWTQWKRGRTRYTQLRKRGVGHRLAAQAAGSSHGPWRLAHSPGLHSPLPNAYFAALGLPALRRPR